MFPFHVFFCSLIKALKGKEYKLNPFEHLKILSTLNQSKNEYIITHTDQSLHIEITLLLNCNSQIIA